MKLLAELNDQLLLGQPGVSHAAPRLTARGIVRNANGLYAVMYAEKYGLHSLPGGGVEEGENVLTALRREIREETGCICDDIRELGVVKENRACQDYTQVSYYYVVTASQAIESRLTEAEQSSGTCLQWHTWKEMNRLIRTPEHTTIQRKYLQARDTAALAEYAQWQMP